MTVRKPRLGENEDFAADGHVEIVGEGTDKKRFREIARGYFLRYGGLNPAEIDDMSSDDAFVAMVESMDVSERPDVYFGFARHARRTGEREFLSMLTERMEAARSSVKFPIWLSDPASRGTAENLILSSLLTQLYRTYFSR